MADEVQTQVEQTEVDTGAGEAGVDTGIQETSTELSDGGDITGADNSISIDDEGNFNIADNVVDSHFEEVGRQPVKELDEVAEPQQQITLPEVYTPEDMAKAFIENNIDAKKLPEAVQSYYKAILAEQQRRNEILSLNKPHIEQQNSVPLSVPKIGKQNPLTPQVFAALQKSGKTLASKYLGIEESDFDEYNPNHTNALSLAVSDIRTRAEQIQRERAVQQQEYYAQQVRQIRARNLDTVVSEFKTNADWQDIDQNFYPAWRSSLDQQAQNAVDMMMAEGDPAKITGMLKIVVKAYEASKNKGQSAKKSTLFAPSVMGGSEQSDVKEAKGMADASRLGDMNPDERAAWFMQNKFV